MLFSDGHFARRHRHVDTRYTVGAAGSGDTVNTALTGAPSAHGHAADVHGAAVGGERELQRLRAEAGTHGRDVHVDGGVGKPGLAGRHRHHFAIAGDASARRRPR